MSQNLILILSGSLVFTITGKLYFDVLNLQSRLEHSQLLINQLTSINDVILKQTAFIQESLIKQNTNIDQIKDHISSTPDIFSTQNIVIGTIITISLGLIIYCVFNMPTNTNIESIVNNVVKEANLESNKVGLDLIKSVVDDNADKVINNLNKVESLLTRVVEDNSNLNQKAISDMSIMLDRLRANNETISLESLKLAESVGQGIQNKILSELHDKNECLSIEIARLIASAKSSIISEIVPVRQVVNKTIEELTNHVDSTTLLDIFRTMFGV